MVSVPTGCPEETDCCCALLDEDEVPTDETYCVEQPLLGDEWIAVAMEKHHGDHADHHAAVLEQFDADGDGELDAEERESAHRHHFDAADIDHNGELSVDELQAAPGPGPMLAEHLGDIDANGNGTLSYDEITTAMEAHHAH